MTDIKSTPDKKSHKSSSKKFRFSAQKLIPLCVTLTFVLLVFNVFLTFQQQTNQKHTLAAITQTLQNLQTQTNQHWQQLTQQFKASTAHWKLLSQLQTELPNWQKQSQNTYHTLLTQLQTLSTQQGTVQKDLSSALNVLKQLNTTHATSLSQKPSHNKRDPGYQTTDQYRIFGVAPYGVILVGPNGDFTVARVGQTLGKLGEVTAISKDRVIAGKYVIHP